ncbi:MAG: RelA/SpoT family protein [Patescibacteria group bacterium]|nr:MAG: RelA/SpoT family protein [Patescibacteria group bacterium]
MTIKQIVDNVLTYLPEADVKILRRAYRFASEAHKEQTRLTGEPYIEHPLETAYILSEIKADLPIVCAGILHDVPEDTDKTLEDLEKNFGPEIAKLVEGITKLGKIKYRGIKRYRENLRKMFLAMAEDPRVILIKFADRLHNLRTLRGLVKDKRKRIAQETLEIYAPIAGLLGISSLKWQMEDLCFKELHPKEYEKLRQRYEIERKAELKEYIAQMKEIAGTKLLQEGIKHELEGRFKHLYSIWQKMQIKNRAFDEIHDVFALRIVVDNVADCYKSLGVVHSIWRPNYARFKDYIAVPKPNGYRSIHTTVFGLEGKSTEFQIRTHKMHEESLYGISAHWYYKQPTGNSPDTMPKWVKEILEIQRGVATGQDFITEIKFDVFQDRIFVFTPKGDVHDLPRGATPIDFAYDIHTDIGNKSVASRINNRIAPLDQELKNGDVVEIITDQNRAGPNYDWLSFIKTRRARDKIKQYAKKSRLESIKRFFPGFKK